VANSQASYKCGSGGTAKIPYFVLLALMVATTFYQQYQMQRASPPGSASAQQQQIMRIFPLMFGFLGFTFPAGLVLYWTIANVFMISQQWVLLRAGHIGPEAMERRRAEHQARQASGDGPKKGWMASLMERAQQERQSRGGQQPTGKADGKGGGGSSSGRGRSGDGSKGRQGRQGQRGAKGAAPRGSARRRPRSGPPRPKKPGGGGGNDG
jgi:hypothetical protein